MNRRLISVMFLGCVCAARGFAEEPKDPQAVYEARSRPGDGQKFLEKFVGTWEVVKTFHPRTGEPVVATGECVQTMIHGGRFLRSEFVFQQGELKTSGSGLIGYEPETGYFTSNWTDSRATKMSMRQGQNKFNGEEIVLYSKSLDGKETRKSRTQTRLDGGKIIHKQFALAPDGAERLMMELVMTKKADAK